jgi:hypothetical protein
VDVGGLEPPAPCLQIKESLFWLFGINNLQSHYSVELQLFGLFWSGFRTFSVPHCASRQRTRPSAATALAGSLSPLFRAMQANDTLVQHDTMIGSIEGPSESETKRFRHVRIT